MNTTFVVAPKLKQQQFSSTSSNDAANISTDA